MVKISKTEIQKELEDDLGVLLTLRDDAYKMDSEVYDVEDDMRFLDFFKHFVKKWGK